MQLLPIDAVDGESSGPRQQLARQQLARLQELLEAIATDNPFYRAKLGGTSVGSMDDYRRLPFTTKLELSDDQDRHPPYGTNLTYGPEHFIRVHQTSGTTGKRLRWLDTEESWQWWGRCWRAVYEGAGVTAADRLFFAFSFGPFVGFWSAHEGARHLGALAFPGGGMSSQQRVEAIVANDVTVLVCTPTYALHLAEAAEALGADIAGSAVRATIHAGEPGASIPATKRRLEQAWGARCFDHAGATEVGAWGYECQAQNGLHLNEEEFIFEVVDPDSREPAVEGELAVTNLGRIGMPVIRYLTGDRVRITHDPCPCGRISARLIGGVIGRIDDALIVRGVTFFPSAIENIVRRHPEVAEFVVDIHRRDSMDELQIRLELADAGASAGGRPAASLVKAVSGEVRNNLGLRPRVELVDNLPRYELKARRFTDHRAGS